jgi:hypothetical protein
LAIHAAGRALADDVDLPDGLVLEDLPLGEIVGVVDLVDCVRVEDLPEGLRDDPTVCGPFCWILSNPRLLSRPHPCKGSLRLWDWDTPEDLTLP